MAGTLTLFLDSAKGLPSKDWFGKQDPYVTVKCGKQKPQNSKTHLNGGKNPSWKESMTFQLTDEAQLDLTLMDEDSWHGDNAVPDAIGTVAVPLAKAIASGSDSLILPVLNPKGKQQGTITLSLTFVPQPVEAAAPAPPADEEPAAPASPAWDHGEKHRMVDEYDFGDWSQHADKRRKQDE